MISEYSKCLEDIPPSGIRRFFDLVIGAKDIISLGVGEPDFVTPWSVRETAMNSLEKGVTSYTSNAGLIDCRKAVTRYLKKRFKVTYNAEKECLLTLGVSEGVDIVVRSILNPGDEVIILTPSYVCYEPLVRLAGGVVKFVKTEESGFIPTVESIAEKVTSKTKAIILCSPSNPTGMSIPEPILKGIADLAEKHDFWVISDEIYAEISYGPYRSFASLPKMKKRTILLSGFSKAFAMTGWRLGYVCGPVPLVERALKIHQYSALRAPVLAQYAAIDALENCLDDVEMMRKSYEQRRNLFVTGLNEAGLATPMPDGAFYCFTDIRSSGMTSEEFALTLLKKHKVAVVPGTAFGPTGEGYIRCCYAIDENDLKEALSRIQDFVKGR